MEWTRARWSNYSIRSKTTLAVLLPMTALLLSCCLIAWVSNKHDSADSWVIHTLQVRLALANFEKQFRATETGALDRGIDRKSSVAAGHNTLAEIQELTSDNRSQQGRIEQLQSTFDKYTQPAVGERERDAEEIRIKQLVAEMDQEEIRLLRSRTDLSADLHIVLSFVIAATLLVGILGTVLAIHLLSRNVSKRIADLIESSMYMREGVAIKALDSSRDELGQLAATIAQTSTVLTERAAQIAETQWKFESVLRAATSACIIAEDSRGKITLFSPGATRLLGYRREEAIGRRFQEIVQNSANTTRDIRALGPSTGSNSKDEETIEYDAVYVRNDGMPLHVHVSSTPLKGLSGKPVGRLHVAQDITPQKVLEQELRGKIGAPAHKEQTLPDLDDRAEGILPEWLNTQHSGDAERLFSSVNALNRWHETHGHIANPNQQENIDAPRILIVDDFEATRALLRVYLQEEGYQLDFAGDGKQALELVAQSAYKLIVMDVEMPVMDGYEAASRIRKWEKAQGREPVPIVALSAQEQSELDTTIWTSYIQKPVSKFQLLQVVRSYSAVTVA